MNFDTRSDRDFYLQIVVESVNPHAACAGQILQTTAGQTYFTGQNLVRPLTCVSLDPDVLQWVH